ncbi:gpW family protein [Burkholderia pseudomallei]|uniref:gpW family protein n=1 Tax=Burkholderia pseudomallei TaxID=28450 RepID=UPI001E52B4D5|nr:gpW family protein [Burkholderia pseudomallei]
MRYNPNLSVLAGMTQTQLQAALAAAQQAYTDLMTGQKVVDVSYAQGDGNKHVRFTEANVQNLVAFISEIRTQLGLQHRARRPITFRY